MVRKSIGIVSGPLLLFSFSFLAGCGNVYERLEEGQWRVVEQVIPVVKNESSPDVLRASIRDGGTGREILPGSAVWIRIEPRSGSLRDPKTLASLPRAEGWLWVGHTDAPNLTRLAKFGSPFLRESIVGMREGGRLRVYANTTRTGPLVLPTGGFLMQFAYKSNWRQLIPAGGADLSGDYQYVEIAGEGDYDIHIGRVCESQLRQKESRLRQWGYVFNMGDQHYKFARDGLLAWLAIEVDCGAEKIHLEKGPAYGFDTPGYRDNPLLSWYESFETVANRGR